ncbi:spore germination protein GerPB [Aquibacillus koreensis]|uniref:Spore germination protein GerPB n=1 Tax=Aquibacillus koreensis TaxID=279446 RepID=A0A9X3WK48_9BACI|nr:spore germination protein GerPB [Aquibacillus koreensis]MCT2535610.1 spore germination protein GerPB [Aquibacillus koreensis]MDC3420105.1 spore germination protein GerPB [Aquibacillus koreensis]
MHLTVHQAINIHMLKVGSVSNSSVLQIGSAGSIQSTADLYNTGGYTELAEPVEPEGAEVPLIPLAPPS